MMILKEPGEINNNHGDVAKTISFELDIIGRPTRFSICVAQKQARLSDITPLARMLSTKLAIIVLDKLHSNGEFVPCRKGCSACCNYLIPLSVPETFRLREVLAMPTEQGRAVSQSFLDTAKIILNEKSKKFEINESAETSCQIQINQLSKWYASLKLACPFLSNNLCTSYEHRPIACREHIVTDSALLCDDERSDESQIVQIPISILHCLGQMTAELEQSDIEAVMLPLALPWVQENLERGERTWSAVTMVECFVEILQALNIEQSKARTTKIPQLCS
ncbi:MAG: YkgJ family cysteine cluster protein [Planctomycetes bacterium]|nr:YkgJ family cysteine cluster protein [Planctomycetota bacterium]MBL7143490.1 YkgJ family cysteine cluster protein [Phycisphaerae bacterium]